MTAVAVAAPVSVQKAQLQNPYYGHGGFMGAANELWNDPHWNTVLEALLPDVHADIFSSLQNGGGTREIIAMLENNPVMSAFSVVTARGSGKVPAFEWDVWFDPALVQAWIDSGQDSDAQKRLLPDILETTVIAHGSLKQNAIETNLGIHQYSNVRKLPKAKFGGLLAKDWMHVFATALSLAGGKASAIEQVKSMPRVAATDASTLHAFLPELRMNFSDAMDVFKQKTDGGTFSVVLDIKHYSPTGARNFMPTLLDSLAREMNTRGMMVLGFGAFAFHKFPPNSHEQAISGSLRAAPSNLVFFHNAAGLQKALHSPGSRAIAGSSVLFNAAWLVKYDSAAETKDQLESSLCIDAHTIGCLAIYQSLFDLKIGIYVQEYDMSPGGYDVLAKAVNTYGDVFQLGFAWGGVDGKIPADIELARDKAGRWRVPCGGGMQDTWLVGEKHWNQDLSRGTLMLAWLRALAEKQRAELKKALAAEVGDETVAGLSDETFARAVQCGISRGSTVEVMLEAVAREDAIDFVISVRAPAGLRRPAGAVRQVVAQTVPFNDLPRGGAKVVSNRKDMLCFSSPCCT